MRDTGEKSLPDRLPLVSLSGAGLDLAVRLDGRSSALHVSHSTLRKFRLDHVEPQPRRAIMTPDSLLLDFGGAPELHEVQLRLTPVGFGFSGGSVWSSPATLRNLNTFVVPFR